MKIPLIVRERHRQFSPFARVAIKGCPLGFLALVDTGSPWTVVTPMGMSMLKIRALPKSKVPRDYPNVKFAGHEFKRRLVDLNVCMKDENGKITTFDKPPISLLISKKQIDPKEFKEVPIVIGCDFLTANKFFLHFNPCQKTAFFQN